MISNLEILDDRTALAFGQKFDVPRVLEAAVAFLKPFATEIVAAAPHIHPTIRFPGDGDRLDPLDEDGYARLRRESIGPGNLWDVDATSARVDVGTIRLRLHLRGSDDLQRIGQGVPTLIGEAPWEELDPTPFIGFQPAHGSIPLFSDKALTLVQKLIRRHAPEGTLPDFDRTPALRFPHHAYGAGLGTLRISLLTVPVDP